MLLPLKEQPDRPVVRYDQSAKEVMVEINSRYMFTSLEYHDRVNRLLRGIEGEAATSQVQAQITAAVHDIMLEAWHRGDILVDELVVAATPEASSETVVCTSCLRQFPLPSPQSAMYPQCANCGYQAPRCPHCGYQVKRWGRSQEPADRETKP